MVVFLFCVYFCYHFLQKRKKILKEICSKYTNGSARKNNNVEINMVLKNNLAT